MKINVQSIKFDADQKLLDFIDKKVGKLEKFFDNIISCDVALTVQPDHGKTVKVRLGIPGDDLDVLQDQIKKMKEKRFGK